jgi:hypothetical protein
LNGLDATFSFTGVNVFGTDLTEGEAVVASSRVLQEQKVTPEHCICSETRELFQKESPDPALPTSPDLQAVSENLKKFRF